MVDVDRAALYLEAQAFGYERQLASPPPRQIPLAPCPLHPLRDPKRAFVAHHRALARHHTTASIEAAA